MIVMSIFMPFGFILFADGIVSIRLADKGESHEYLKRFGRLLRTAIGIVLMMI